jgi:hypothetical protein
VRVTVSGASGRVTKVESLADSLVPDPADWQRSTAGAGDAGHEEGPGDPVRSFKWH